jgi:hypothetical protein
MHKGWVKVSQLTNRDQVSQLTNDSSKVNGNTNTKEQRGEVGHN